MDWIRRGLLVLSVVALVGACGDDESAEPTTTTAESTTTTETTTSTPPPPDPSVIPADPADIDEAYVEAVLAELERIDGDALRLVKAQGPSPEVSALVTSINTPQEGVDQINALVDQYVTGALDDLAPVPGDVVNEIVTVLVAEPDCISVEVEQDYSARGPSGLSGVRTRVDLVPSDGGSSLNPTAWVFAGRYALDESIAPPQQPCAD